MDEYDQQAQNFLDKFGITYTYTHLGDVYKWNGWRHHYHCTFTRTNQTGKELIMTVPFFGSIQDHKQGRKDVRAYEVLAAISGDHQFLTVEDIRSAFGDDLTGIDVRGLLRQAREMRLFFTPKALDELCEIV